MAAAEEIGAAGVIAKDLPGFIHAILDELSP